MTGVRSNLLEDKQAIEADMAPLLKQLAPLQVRHARVCLALEALTNVTGAEKNQSFITSRKGRVLKPEGTMRIKPMVIAILKKHPDGLKALEILGAIKDSYSVEIMRTSLSPQLSRLKRDGKIENIGKLWLLSKDKPSDESEGLN